MSSLKTLASVNQYFTSLHCSIRHHYDILHIISLNLLSITNEHAPVQFGELFLFLHYISKDLCLTLFILTLNIRRN